MIELNQPVDMNGVDIPIDTCCLYDEQGNEHEVQEWVYNQTTKKWSFKSEGSDGYDPGLFCVSNPADGDSRKRLLQDLRIAEFAGRNGGMWCCAYLGRGYFHCSGCPANDDCANYVISDIAALKSIIFLEDDETGEEYCEVGDILDALDIHPELGEYLYHDDVERLVDIVGARWSHGFVPMLKSSAKAHRYKLNAKALKIWMIENDVTRKRLGEMIGTTSQMLGNWINKGTEPRIGSVLALADVTGMDIYDLMEVADD